MLGIFKKKIKENIVAPKSNISELVREGNNLFSDELILLNEKLSGNLFCAEKVVIEQNGILAGNITSKLCVVSGTINGDIVSAEQMDIKSTARIKGNIRSPLINIEPGAIINGSITTAEDKHIIIADQLQKAKENLADEYLGAKVAGLIDEVNHKDNPVSIKMKGKQPQKAPVESIPNPITAPTSPAAQQKEISDENTNQRWW